MEEYMLTTEMLKNAFRDELEKISFTRSGRKPIGVERLLEREAESEETPSNLFSGQEVDPETFKEDIEKLSSLGKGLAAAGLGAGVMLLAQRANRDRKLGRTIRLQQDQQY